MLAFNESSPLRTESVAASSYLVCFQWDTATYSSLVTYSLPLQVGRGELPDHALFILFKDTKVLSHINEAGLAQIYPTGRSRYPGHQGPDFCFDFVSFPLSSGCGSLLHPTSLLSTLCFMFFFSRSSLFRVFVFVHPPLWVCLCASFPWEGSRRKKPLLFGFALSLHPQSQLLPT